MNPISALMVKKQLFVPRLLVVTLIPLAIAFATHLIMTPGEGPRTDAGYSYPPFAGLLSLGLILYAIRSVRRSLGMIGHGDEEPETPEASDAS